MFNLFTFVPSLFIVIVLTIIIFIVIISVTVSRDYYYCHCRHRLNIPGPADKSLLCNNAGASHDSCWKKNMISSRGHRCEIVETSKPAYMISLQVPWCR